MGRRNKSKKILEEKDLNNLSDGVNILNNYKEKLSKERENRKGKTVDQIKKEEYIEETKYSKIRPFVITILLIFLVLLIYIFFMYGPIFGISINKTSGVSEERSIDLVSTDEDIYKEYNSEFLVYSNQYIRTYNSQAKKTWEYKLSSQFTPSIYVQGRYMAVSNNSTGTIFLFEGKKEISDIKISGTVESIYLDDIGNMAVEYSTSGYKKVIGVYSKDGKNLYTAHLSTNAILDIKIINNGQKIIVVQTNASSFKIGVTINIIDGTKDNDNIKEIMKLDNNLVYDLTTQDENIIILLDDKIISYNLNTNSTKEIKNFGNMQLMFISLYDNYYTYVEKETGNESGAYVVKTERLDATSIGSVNISDSPKIMKNSGLLNYLIYQDKLQVINKWGVETKDIKIDSVPKDIIVFNNEKSVALIYTNKVYIVNM